MVEASGTPWNHNVHYFPLILGLVGEQPRGSAIDVGSGDGMLASRIAETVPSVVGIDADAAQVDFSRHRYAGISGLRFEHGDVLTSRLEDEPFDVVTCSAALHLLPLEAGLARLGELTAPGGTLIVVGRARDESPGDRALSVLSVVPHRIARAIRGWYEHGSPSAEPRESYREIREAAARILPGSVFRRRMYWRYSLVWQRPLSA
jgi:SAM-dependent methyltransferase